MTAMQMIVKPEHLSRSSSRVPYDAPMQISMWVPYDERRLRRTLKVVLRPQVRLIRILGAVLTVLGLLVGATGGSLELIVVAVALGVVCMTVVGPLTTSQAVRMQSAVIKDGFHMTLSDEWLTVVYPLAESRYRWAGVDKVIDTPEAWYLMCGRAQAFAIPKDTMTPEQRTEFAAFLAALAEQQAGRAFLGQSR
jgi:hypothetical protein